MPWPDAPAERDIPAASPRYPPASPPSWAEDWRPAGPRARESGYRGSAVLAPDPGPEPARRGPELCPCSRPSTPPADRWPATPELCDALGFLLEMGFLKFLAFLSENHTCGRAQVNLEM